MNPHASKLSDLNTSGPLTSRSGRMLSGQPRTKQFFDWGLVEWLVEPDGPGPERISVGEVTFYSHRGEAEHSHYGEEQVLHVISGRALHCVNGQCSQLEEGDTVYLPPYCTHTMTNAASEDLILLCVYSYQKVPASLMTNDPAPEEGRTGLELASIIDLDSTSHLLSNLSQALKLSMGLFDLNGNCLIESMRRPNLCRRLSASGDHCRKHIAAAIGNLADRHSSHFAHCCGQVSTLIIPVISGTTTCGYIKCGEFFISPSDQAAMSRYLTEYPGFPAEPDLRACLADISVEKKSRLYSAAEAASAVASYIAENGLAMLRRRELAENRIEIINEQMTTATLERALREADFKLLQSQINPHFLFNTLNIISQMAYMEGADTAAGLVCSLADLMRATLRKANQLVPLREEISLLKDYLAIQKARFAERLEVLLEVEESLSEVPLPILILQPLVENAIVHGLELKLSGCRVEIIVKRISGGRISLSVRDDGVGFPEDRSTENKGLGLKSIEARLSHFFNDQFTFEIQSRAGCGAFIEITVPDRRIEP